MVLPDAELRHRARTDTIEARPLTLDLSREASDAHMPATSGRDGLNHANSMRVLFAMNFKHLPQAVAGSQWTTDELCKGLAADGVRCAVLASLGPRGLLGFRTRALAKVMGWSRVPPDRSAGYPVYRRWLPPQAVPEVKARFQPSVAVVMSGAPSTMVEALLANSVPTIWYILDVEPENLAWQPSGRRGLTFLACSQFAAERAKQALGIQATVIPPIVDAQRYRVQTSRRSVIFINPVSEKGVEIAIGLAERRPDIPFEFVECWEITDERKRYRPRAAACANITWHKPTLDIRQVFRRGRVLLAPSQWDEAWGRVVSEAQASGIPVIASRRGGLPEAVGPGGILVEAESGISVWQDALSCLWDDADAYSEYSAAALTHSQRPELEGKHVISRFKDSLWRHYRQIVHATQ